MAPPRGAVAEMIHEDKALTACGFTPAERQLFLAAMDAPIDQATPAQLDLMVRYYAAEVARNPSEAARIMLDTALFHAALLEAA